MKFKIFFVSAVFAVMSCKQETKNAPQKLFKISEKVSYVSEGGFFKFKSGKFSYSVDEKKLPFKRTIFLNASLLGYVCEIKAENSVIGVASPEYIFSQDLNQKINSDQIVNIGNEQKYDLEKIIALRPDAVFTNYIASFENTYQLLKNNGIKVFFLDEYTEQKPLEKTAYIKLFGKLFGKEKLAEKRYKEISEEYEKLKNLASHSKDKPEILANEMYGDIWYLPGGKTFTANYISDAGGDYFLKNNTEGKALTMNFEEVYSKSQNVKYWINAGNHHSKKEMLAVNPLYSKLNVFNKGKIYAVTAKEKGKSNDFFESGVVRADLILKDYIKIFHPELLANYQLTYMKEVQ
jgi:iron complex transport system substrate-binding protein